MTAPTLFETTKSLVPTDSPAFIGITTAIVRHVLGADNAYACQRSFKEHFDFAHSDTSAQKFRLLLSDSSYIHLNIKYFCLNLVAHGMNSDKLKLFQEQFGIDRNDVVLVKKVLEQRGLRKNLKASTEIAKITKEQITKKEFDKVFEVFNTIYPAVHKHIKNKTYTKLRFISTSSNMEFYDLHMELTCKVLQAYIKKVPTDMTPLHIANYLRSAVNNHTVNIIKSHTTQKRRRMVQGASDGFGGFTYEIPVVSENQLFSSFGLENLSYEGMSSTDSRTEEDRVKESDISFDMILRRFGKTKKRRAFIALISMQENAEFTKFLNEQERIEGAQDNVDYSELAGQRAYFDAVCEHLSLRKSQARKFMLHIARVAYPEKLAEGKPNAK